MTEAILAVELNLTCTTPVNQLNQDEGVDINGKKPEGIRTRCRRQLFEKDRRQRQLFRSASVCEGRRWGGNGAVDGFHSNQRLNSPPKKLIHPPKRPFRPRFLSSTQFEPEIFEFGARANGPPISCRPRTRDQRGGHPIWALPSPTINC